MCLVGVVSKEPHLGTTGNEGFADCLTFRDFGLNTLSPSSFFLRARHEGIISKLRALFNAQRSQCQFFVARSQVADALPIQGQTVYDLKNCRLSPVLLAAVWWCGR